jgi:REP element-mobilizing transposase RayT
MQHNRKLNRLNGHDYSRDHLYFVTSCVKNRVCCFGEIVPQKMHLNEYGKIVENQWHWLGRQYPYVVLHAFVVMPNHINGIIEMKRSDVRTSDQQQQKIKSLLSHFNKSCRVFSGLQNIEPGSQF